MDWDRSLVRLLCQSVNLLFPTVVKLYKNQSAGAPHDARLASSALEPSFLGPSAESEQATAATESALGGAEDAEPQVETPVIGVQSGKSQ